MIGYLVPGTGRAITCAAALGLVAMTVAWRPAPPAAARGVSFQLVMKLRPPATRNARTNAPTFLHGTGVFANGKARIDIDSASGPVSFSKGDYFVIDSATTLLIRPSVQTYSEIESPILNPLSQLAGTLSNAQIAVSGIKVELHKLGMADSVANMRTQHFRIEAEYVLDLGTRQLNTEITTDIWVAKLPFRFISPVDRTMRNPKMPPAFGAIFDRIDGYSKQIAAEGTTVRSSTVTTLATSGVTLDVSQSAELVNLREAEVDEGVFRIPERFKKGDVPPF